MSNDALTVTANRFVILLHTAGPALGRTSETHFDWMFETGDTLVTFATAVRPLIDQWDGNHDPLQLPAQRLTDHRRDYLDYEGEISGGRGSIRRWLAGNYHLRRQDADLFAARLHWPERDTTRFAEVCFQRGSADFRRIDNREEWWLRLESGWKETNW